MIDRGNDRGRDRSRGRCRGRIKLDEFIDVSMSSVSVTVDSLAAKNERVNAQ